MKKSLVIRICLSVVVAVLFLMGVYLLVQDEPDIAYQYETNCIGNTDIVGEITSDVCVKQEIYGVKEFWGVRVLFATYGNPNINSLYHVQMITETDDIIYDKIIDATDIEDNSYYYIALDEPYDLSDSKVTLVITSVNAVAGNALTIWRSGTDQYEAGKLYVDDVYIEGDIVFDNITNVTYNSNINILIYRIATVLLICIFLYLNIWIPLGKLYDFIFKYRLVITFAIFIVLVFNKIHFSSIDMYDEYIQPTLESGYDEPIWGEARPIRSDEWLVSTPVRLTTAFAGTGDTNYIPMALEMGNLTSSSLQFGWSALAEPYEWGFYLGDIEIGVSWYWNFVFLFSIYFSFEMCLFLSKGNRLLSLLGGVLIGCSPFFFWWSGLTWLVGGQGAIVCVRYALNTEKKSLRLIFGILTAIFAVCFIKDFYPAWEIPAGFMFLILLAMIIVYAWEKIKCYDKWDWIILIACVIFMLSILAAYLITYMEYIVAILNTVYPAARIGLGGEGLTKLGYYIGAWMYPLKGVLNPCESSVFFNLFPLPLVLGVYYMIKEKKWDGLIGSLSLLSLFFVAYCAIGFPEWLAKITLMSSSTGKRTIDILALVQLYLFIVVAGKLKEELKLNCILAFIIVFACVFIAGLQFESVFPEYYNKYQILTIVAVITLCIVPWISCVKKIAKVSSLIVVCIVSIGTGVMVNPVMKGLDTIYTKPVAKEIMSIVEEEPKAKWIATDSIIASSFAISCGAPTITSTNFIPNYELWSILDPEGIYEECWNRYAHINLTLTEEDTSVELISTDTIRLYLSYEDLEKIDVRYIYSSTPINSVDVVEFEEIYNMAGSYIYKLNYN